MNKIFAMFILTFIVSACGKVEVMEGDKDLHGKETTCLDTTNNAKNCK